MKKLFLFTGILMISLISACSKDDGNSSIKNIVINTVSAGTWKITYFFDNNTEETSKFSGYDFTFGSNNVLSASNVSNTYTGSWSITNNNSTDDSLDDVDFIILFASPANFEDLSEDWEILSRTESEIELKHVSGGGGGTDLLTFVMN